MKDLTKNWIIAILFLILLAGTFWLGYSRYPIFNPVTEIHDTIIKVDTFEHRIRDTIPWLVVKTDTIITRDTISTIIDTVVILKAYYAFYTYTRIWQDSSLKVTLKDVVSENKVMDSWFDYKILRSQSIINTTNITYNYQKYLYLGLQSNLFDLRYSSFNVYFASPRLLIGGGYIPYQKAPVATIALKLVKFGK